MTLIHDDEVEKVSGKLLVIIVAALAFPAARLQLLVKPKEDFFGGLDILVINLLHRVRKGLKVLFHRLVNEKVAVCQIENLFEGARLPEPVHNLKTGECLTRSCRHNNQEALRAFHDFLDGAVDCYALIITGFLSGRGDVVRKGIDVEGLRGYRLFFLIPFPKFLDRREILHFHCPV